LDRPDRSVPGRWSVKGEAGPAVDFTPMLLQHEDQFAYDVVAHALDRSADVNRFLDTLFFALMAAQAAIYAIILDKIEQYSRLQWQLLLGGFIVAAISSSLTLFVREGPDPDAFTITFPGDPRASRLSYIDQYVAKANGNRRLQIVKTVGLTLSLGLTIVPLVLATAGRLHLVAIGAP
jgi:hypothetical protein